MGSCASRSVASTPFPCSSRPTPSTTCATQSAPRISTRPRTSMRRASTARISPACSPSAPPGRRSADGRRRQRQRHCLRARRRAAQAPHPFPPRRPRPHRQPHRLRHRQLRRVLGDRRRRAREELHDARRPGRRCNGRDRRGARRGRAAVEAPAGVQRRARAAVRLLHAGDADERDRAVAREPAPEPRGDPQGAAGQHLPLYRLLEHLRGHEGGVRMSATETVEVAVPTVTWSGQSVPRKEDKRLVQGQGVFIDDMKRHAMGYLHFVRSPYAHAHITSIDISAAEKHPGVYGTLTGEEVASLTDPFFQIASVPGANVKDYALAVGKVRYVGEPIVAVVAETREAARDASELVEVEFEPIDAVTDARFAQDGGVPTIHEDAGGNLMWHGVYEWGDLDAAFAEADKVVKIDELHFHRFNSTPLECDGALVEYNRGTGQWTLHTNNQFPGFAAIMMGPAMRTGLDKLRFVTQDIGGGFGNKITSHPQLVVCCLLARKLNRPIQWTEWRTDFHLSMSHGNERWFLDTEVAVKNDGTLLGFRTRALDDAGAYLRYEPLGGVIWAQVTPGMYKWRHIRVDFTQVATNKAPVSPNRGYSRMQHLWFTERVIDIVAHELDLDPVEVRKRNYVTVDDMPYETPNGCVYDSGDYARMLDIALELVDYGSVAERRADAEARGKLLGIGIGSTLDSGTNNFGQSRLINPELQFSGNNEVATVKLDIFGEIVVTLGTTPQGQGHETTAAQVVADILRCSVDDVHVRAGHDSYWNSHAGFSGTYASQFAVTGLSAVKGATEMLRDEIFKLAGAVFGGVPAEALELADGGIRIKENP